MKPNSTSWTHKLMWIQVTGAFSKHSHSNIYIFFLMKPFTFKYYTVYIFAFLLLLSTFTQAEIQYRGHIFVHKHSNQSLKHLLFNGVHVGVHTGIYISACCSLKFSPNWEDIVIKKEVRGVRWMNRSSSFLIPMDKKIPGINSWKKKKRKIIIHHHFPYIVDTLGTKNKYTSNPLHTHMRAFIIQ